MQPELREVETEAGEAGHSRPGDEEEKGDLRCTCCTCNAVRLKTNRIWTGCLSSSRNGALRGTEKTVKLPF